MEQAPEGFNLVAVLHDGTAVPAKFSDGKLEIFNATNKTIEAGTPIYFNLPQGIPAELVAGSPNFWDARG